MILQKDVLSSEMPSIFTLGIADLKQKSPWSYLFISVVFLELVFELGRMILPKASLYQISAVAFDSLPMRPRQQTVRAFENIGIH